MLVHAYQEMLDVLNEHKKMPSDIEWVSVREGEVDKTLFLLNIEGTWYEKDSPFVELNASMIIGGKDFRMTRVRTSGSERWEFHRGTLPYRPSKKAPILYLWIVNGVTAPEMPDEDEEEEWTCARPLKIYVAGPYTAYTPADVEKNVRTAMDVGVALFHKGHFPFIPHLSHYLDRRASETNSYLTWDDYMRRDLAWLEVADAFFFIKESKGAIVELEAARTAGLDIYYELSEVPNVCSGYCESEEKRK